MIKPIDIASLANRVRVAGIGRATAVATALALAVALATAPLAAAKGRPTRVAADRTSCFDFIITTTFWKQFDVHGVQYVFYVVGTDQVVESLGYAGSASLTSPLTDNISTTYAVGQWEYIVVTLYSDTTFPATHPVGTATTDALFNSCGV